MKSIIFSLKLFVMFVMTTYFSYAQTIVKPAPLSKNDVANLIKMREEEKLAHDVYTYLAEKWDHQVFKNILQSEKMHGNMIKDLLENYQIKDPYMEEKGKFQDAFIQNLYTDFTIKGSQSLQDAFWVGAIIEDLDTADLDILIASTNHQNIVEVYEELNRGSRNHIRAYTRQLSHLDTQYTPKYISSERYATILKTDHEEGKQCHTKNAQNVSSTTKSCPGEKGISSCTKSKTCCASKKDNKKSCNH